MTMMMMIELQKDWRTVRRNGQIKLLISLRKQEAFQQWCQSIPAPLFHDHYSQKSLFPPTTIVML
jgi:hypothetical protein